VVKKLTIQHSRWLADWEGNEDGSVYKELKAAYKKFVSSEGMEVPKAWEEVSRGLFVYTQCVGMTLYRSSHLQYTTM